MEVSKKEIVHRKTKDHWAFLEEIEAPMWVDLTAEGNFSSQVINSDSWFESSHQFHRLSSQRLKSAFCHSGLDLITSDMDLRGSSSPQLPSSVSRSRGTRYQSKNWRKHHFDTSFEKQHSVRVLNGSSFHVDNRSNQLTKTKLSFINPKRISGSKPLVSVESRNSVRVHSETKSTSGSGCQGDLSSGKHKDRRSNTRSTITSEDSQQEDESFTEVSSRQFCQASETLRGKRTTFRETCVKKKASGLEIYRGKHSSIGKSSSGISSISSGSIVALQHKSSTVTSSKQAKNTPERRHVSMSTLASRSRKEPYHLASTSTDQVHLRKSNFRKGSRANLAKSANHECGIPQVKYQTVSPQVFRPVTKQNLYDVPIKMKAELGIIGHDNSALLGKENLAGLVHQRFNERGIPSKDLVTNFKSLQKHGNGGSIVLKTKKNQPDLTKNSTAVVDLR